MRTKHSMRILKRTCAAMASGILLLTSQAFANAQPGKAITKSPPISSLANPQERQANTIGTNEMEKLVGLDSAYYFSEDKKIEFKKGASPDTSFKDQGKKDSSNGSQPLVVGGIPTPEGERGYQVSLMTNGFHLCGGSLISSEWVLTAAHCVAPDIARNQMTVTLGTQVLGSPSSIEIPVSQIIAHDNFNSTGALEDDIALVRLAFPAPDSIPKLALATEEVMSLFANEGDIATVSGWGYVDNNQTDPERLMQAEVPIANHQTCSDAYENEFGVGVLDTMICASDEDGGENSCNGDSGGPLTITTEDGDFSIGIVSYGAGLCAIAEFPSVYTRTASYLDWISEKMQTPEPPERINFLLDESVDFSVAVDGKAHIGINSLTSMSWMIQFLSESSVNATVYNGYYPVRDNQICQLQEVTDAACEFPLTNAGYYLLELTSESAGTNTVNLSNVVIPATLQDGSVYQGFDLGLFQIITIPFEITEEGQDLNVILSGDNGDADLFIFPNFDTDWACDSFTLDSNESCSFENAEVGSYTLVLVGFSISENLTLEFHLTESSHFMPLAICEHQVVTQIGKYFIASISIVNISDEFLEDWFVTWDYSMSTDIKWIQNGIITSTSPYVAQAKESGHSIAPGGSATLLALVKSPSKTAENPVVSGNFCQAQSE